MLSFLIYIYIYIYQSTISELREELSNRPTEAVTVVDEAQLNEVRATLTTVEQHNKDLEQRLTVEQQRIVDLQQQLNDASQLAINKTNELTVCEYL